MLSEVAATGWPSDMSQIISQPFVLSHRFIYSKNLRASFAFPVYHARLAAIQSSTCAWNLYFVKLQTIHAYLVWILDLYIFEGNRNEFALRGGPLYNPVFLDRTNNVLNSTYNGLLEVLATRAYSFKVSLSRVLVHLLYDRKPEYGSAYCSAQYTYVKYLTHTTARNVRIGEAGSQSFQ